MCILACRFASFGQPIDQGRRDPPQGGRAVRCAYRSSGSKVRGCGKKIAGDPQPLEALNTLTDFEDAETLDVPTVLGVVENSDHSAVNA